MKKLTKRNLDTMQREMRLLNEEEQRRVIGGTGTTCGHGIPMDTMCPVCSGDPVATWDDYLRLDGRGEWNGGWYYNTEGMPCYAPPSSGEIVGGGVTGYCKQHGEYRGDKCYSPHLGGGDEYCEKHYYWYDEYVGCNECRKDQTVTGYCAEHDERWVDKDGITGCCSVCGATSDTDNSGGTSSGNPGNPGNPGQASNLTDGINVEGSKHIVINTQGNMKFEQQIKDVLISNSVLKNLLAYPDRGFVNLTIVVGTVDGGQAITEKIGEGEFRITFDESCVDKGGWNKILKHDNVDYDWSKVRNEEEAFVVAMTHEAIHAKHHMVYEEADRMGVTIRQSVDYLLNNGYSEDFVKVFYTQDANGKWDYSNNQAQNMEDYIKKYDHGIIDDALEEYRNDHKNN